MCIYHMENRNKRIRIMHTKTYKKVCARCNFEKPVTDFNIKRDSRDGRQAYCQLCASEYWKKQTPEEKRLKYARQKRSLQRLAQAYLDRSTCMTCGSKKDLAFLKTPGIISLSTIVNMKLSKANLLHTLESTYVVCADCREHRFETVQEIGV